MVMSDSIIRQSIANSIGLDSFNENNPADCLAAIDYFCLDVSAPDCGDRRKNWKASRRTVLGDNESEWIFGVERHLEQAVFAACKKLVEE